MVDIHPRIRQLIEAAYGSVNEKTIKEFLEDYKEVMGEEIDIENPHAGIYVFLKRKWGLTRDALLGIDEAIKVFRHKKFKNLKNFRYAFLLSNMLRTFLNLLYNFNEISINKLDFSAEGNPEKDAQHFANFYGLNVNRVVSFEDLKWLLEKFDIFVYVLPLDTGFHEGISYPDTPTFIVLNSRVYKAKASFLLAHEIGHLIYKRNHNDEEENFANTFATHLVLPDTFLDEIAGIFERSKKEKNFPFEFSKGICLRYQCKVFPKTALMKLYYKGFINKEDLEIYDKKIMRFIKGKAKHKNKVRWLKELTEEIGIKIPSKYREAVERAYEEGKISSGRKKELLLEDLVHVHSGNGYNGVYKFSGVEGRA